MIYKLFRILSDNEIDSIRSEATALDTALLFTDHTDDVTYQANGSLRNGKTCWIQHHDHTKLLYKEFIPTTMSIVEEISHIEGLSKIGRFYFHRLSPGNRIYEHKDVNSYHEQVYRYQIYLDVPAGLHIMHNGPTFTDGAVIRFDHHSLHQYYNDTDTCVTFIVFDLYK